jgi:tubby-related protein 1
MVQCYIQRRKTGLGRLFPTYEIYLKDGDQFLLAARKRKKNKSSNYLISLDKDDLARQSGNFFGKLRSNFIGTEFVLYDKGTNPEKLDQAQKESALVQARQEMGTVLYKQNVLGSRGPRKMKVMVPRIDEGTGQRKVLRPQSTSESMLERYKAAKNDADVMILKNKPPKWNDQVGAYVLNFNGRVTRASVKNFQLCDLARDRARPSPSKPRWPLWGAARAPARRERCSPAPPSPGVQLTRSSCSSAAWARTPSPWTTSTRSARCKPSASRSPPSTTRSPANEAPGRPRDSLARCGWVLDVVFAPCCKGRRLRCSNFVMTPLLTKPCRGADMYVCEGASPSCAAPCSTWRCSACSCCSRSAFRRSWTRR